MHHIYQRSRTHARTHTHTHTHINTASYITVVKNTVRFSSIACSLYHVDRPTRCESNHKTTRHKTTTNINILITHTYITRSTTNVAKVSTTKSHAERRKCHDKYNSSIANVIIYIHEQRMCITYSAATFEQHICVYIFSCLYPLGVKARCLQLSGLFV